MKIKNYKFNLKLNYKLNLKKLKANTFFLFLLIKIFIINLFFQGRGKKNNMGPILAAAVLKIGLIGALAFKGLALLVGKALLLSKVALLLASIIGLKKLFSQQKHVTYEVVAHPHHSASHTFSSEHGHPGGSDSYSSGWARNFHGQAAAAAAAGQELAYSAHVPTA